MHHAHAAPPETSFPDPVVAITMPDPGPVYDALRAGGPVRYDRLTGWWVVTGYRSVVAALTDPGLHTRPRDEVVPAPLIGHPVGRVFGRLIRMTDDPASRTTHHAIRAALASVPTETLRTVLDRVSADVLTDERGRGRPDWPVRTLFRIPVAVIAALLGLPGPDADDLTSAVRAFARAIAPAPFTGPVEAGDEAARLLELRIGRSLDDATPGILQDLMLHPALGQPGAPRAHHRQRHRAARPVAGRDRRD